MTPLDVEETTTSTRADPQVLVLPRGLVFRLARTALLGICALSTAGLAVALPFAYLADPPVRSEALSAQAAPGAPPFSPLPPPPPPCTAQTQNTNGCPFPQPTNSTITISLLNRMQKLSCAMQLQLLVGYATVSGLVNETTAVYEPSTDLACKFTIPESSTMNCDALSDTLVEQSINNTCVDGTLSYKYDPCTRDISRTYGCETDSFPTPSEDEDGCVCEDVAKHALMNFWEYTTCARLFCAPSVLAVNDPTGLGPELKLFNETCDLDSRAPKDGICAQGLECFNTSQSATDSAGRCLFFEDGPHQPLQ